MSNYSEEISVLVSSCDKYEDAWMPFFHFFKKHWKDCPYKIYLNTESKSYKDGELSVQSIPSRGGVQTWSKRLKNALKQIDTEYIIFLLEDFFFLGDVDQAEINKCIKYMEQDKKISCIGLWRSGRKLSNSTLVDSSFSGYKERTQSTRYDLNCQAALWRKKDLIKYLSPYESAWQFEEIGTERAKLYGRRFLLKYKNNAFNYQIVPELGGYGIYMGKWLKSNMELFSKEGITVNFDNLGLCENKEVPRALPSAKINFKWKLMYLLYGGYTESKRMPILKQLEYMFIHPKTFVKACYRKVRFLFKREMGIL